MAAFDQSTPFLLLARIHVKPGCVDQYLEIAQAADAAVKASEPGMIHHPFDRDPEDPQAFVWSEVYANDDAFVCMCPILPCSITSSSMLNSGMESVLRSMALSVTTADR